MKNVFYTLFLLLPCLGLANDEAATTVTSVGQAAPNCHFTTLEGGEFDLQDLRGRVVLLNFFATWCGPCLSELPHLELEVWQKFKNDNFLLICVGREHTKNELVEFTKIVKFSFPIAPDPQREIYEKFATKYIPRTVLIDPSGKIIYQQVGYSEEKFREMLRLIEKLLTEEKTTL